ncbi:diguanylate cyclase [Lysobacter sp. A289]
MVPVNTLPPSKLRPYRIPAFVLSVVVLICVGVAMVLSIRNFTRSTDLVEHSYQVISTAEAIRSSIRSAESSARGYRLSDRDSLLMEYQATLPAIRDATSRLVVRTQDDPDQQARALELETRVDDRMAELQRLVDMQLNLGMAETQREGLNSSGFGQMQQIDALIGTVLSHERHLLLTRRQTMSTLATVTTVGVVAGILLPLALLGLLLGGLTRENRRSRRLERDTRNALRELAVSLEQRSQLSEQRRVLGAYAGILQSCEDLNEALNVTAEVIAQMLPNTGGHCYVLRSSLNQVEAVSGFGTETIPSDLVWTPSACWGIRRGQTHRSGHGPGNVYCSHLHIADLPPDGWTLCVPLMAQGVSLGLLHVNGATGGGVEDVQVVEAVAEQLSLAMINLQLRESLRVQSLRDPLTGLYNRRYLEDNTQRELQRCQRRGLPLSVIMLDVDNFKRFNDEHGHAAGDALLTAIAQTLQEHTRGEDIVCRYGGEEFTVVMPEASAEDARRRAEEIRSAIAATTVVHLRKTLGPTTASLGVATFPVDGSTPAELIGLADKALYRAKAEGRNRLVVHHSTTV